MKNGILLFILLGIAFNSSAQNIDFTDLNLKQFLINENCIDLDDDGYPDINADLNNDGEIQLSEALNITNLTFNYFPDNYHVASVQDLSLFANLQELFIFHFDSLEEFSLIGLDNLTRLLLSSCLSLKHIDISDLNTLDNLRIEDIADLDYLNLQNNNFPSEVFSLFYTENIQYACVDDISEEYNEVLFHMAPGVLPSIECNLGVLNQEANIGFVVYPNPTNGILKIDSTTFESFQAIVFDVNGREVYSMNENNKVIDLSFLSSGVYFLQLKMTHYSIIKRIIKI